MLPDTSLLGLIATGGAGVVAIVLVWLLVPIIRAQQKLQEKLTDAMEKQVSINSDMQLVAKARDQQIDLTLKQMDLVLASMNRNAVAAESQNALLLGIKNETTASGNRTQALHEAFVSGINDTSAAIGTMTSHITDQLAKVGGDLAGQIAGIPQRVLEVFEPTRSELVLKLDNLGPDVAKAIVPDIEHMFKDCLELAKENDALTKEVHEQRERADKAEARLTLAVNAAAIGKPDPEPPDGPGAKAPIPPSSDVIVTLPTTNSEERAA